MPLATENDEQDHRLLFKVNAKSMSDFEKKQASLAMLQFKVKIFGLILLMMLLASNEAGKKLVRVKNMGGTKRGRR